MRQENKSPVALMTMGIAGLFMAGFFLLVIFGAQTYCSIVEGQTRNNHVREMMGYVATCARANDSEGAVRITESEGRPVLVIADGSSGYGLRIYQHEGTLMEDYGQLEAEINPKTAMEIGKTEIFRVEQRADGIYAVTTDAGVVLFHTRSGK